MKKLILLLGVFAVLGSTALAGVDITSVNFYRYGPLGSKSDEIKQNVTLEADQTAGLGAWNTNGWENIDMPFGMSSPRSPVTLTSTYGSTSSFTLKDTRNGNPYDGVRDVMIGDGNADLMDGHANATEDGSAGTSVFPDNIFDMEVSDITLDTYDLIVYMGGNKAQFGDGTGKIVLNGGPAQDFTLTSGRFDGTFTEVVDGTMPGNYILFEGLTGSSFSIQVWGNGYNHLGPTGFQFGDVEVPEPATMALLALGGLGLFRRRRNG